MSDPSDPIAVSAPWGASKDDLAAAARILGSAERTWLTSTVRRRTQVSPSGGLLDAPPYIVEERLDTVNGGLYVFCPCMGWKFAKGRGKDCRHVTVAKERWGVMP